MQNRSATSVSFSADVGKKSHDNANGCNMQEALNVEQQGGERSQHTEPLSEAQIIDREDILFTDESTGERSYEDQQSVTSHIRVGAFDIIVHVSRPNLTTTWPAWNLHLIASDGSSFNIESRQAKPTTSLMETRPCQAQSMAKEACSLDPSVSSILQSPAVMLQDCLKQEALSVSQGNSGEYKPRDVNATVATKGSSYSSHGFVSSTLGKENLPSETEEGPDGASASLVRIVPSLQRQMNDRIVLRDRVTLPAAGKKSPIVGCGGVASDRGNSSATTSIMPRRECQESPDSNLDEMNDASSRIASTMKRPASSSKPLSRKTSRVKYDIRWADPAFYTESQKRILAKAPWPERRDAVTHLPLVYCHKCYLENHKFEQCETTYPKGRWVYWRHFKCGASYIRGHVFPPHLVSQWVNYHVNKQAESSNRRILRNASL